MDFEKLAPWNWFKKEEEEGTEIVPVRRDAEKADQPASILDLQREFDRLFDTLRRDFGSRWSSFSTDALLKPDWFKPSLDVASNEKEYTVKVELPGIDASDVSIEVSDNIMKIKGEKRQESEEKEKDFYRVERSYGSFQRILNLPEDADEENITSSYKDGVLSVAVPRKALPKKDTKKIAIDVK